jgi:predicted nucleic acid-binding protein
MARVIVLDANVLIALLASHDVHHAWALDLFIDSIEDKLVISSLTLSEAMVHPARNGQMDVMLRNITSLGIEVSPLDQAGSINLAYIRARTQLRMPDAVVLHTAIEHNASLATLDARLAQSAQNESLNVITLEGSFTQYGQP